MFKFSTFKLIGMALTIFFGVYFTLPSFLSKEQIASLNKILPSWVLPKTGIVLGLDLQGGSHVMMEVDQAKLIRSQVTQIQDDVRRILREARVPPIGGVAVGPRNVSVRLPNAEDRAKVMPKIRELSQFTGNQNLGTVGARNIEITETPDGLITLALTDAGVNDKVRRSVDQSLEVLRRRVDATGTTEPSIQRQGIDRVVVQVPGLQDPQQLKAILGKTAKLQFKLVAEPGTPASETENLPSEEDAGRNITVERRILVEGEDLISAEPGFDSRTNEPIVNFRFNIRGAQKFGQVTTENVGRPFAIILDNKVISAPRINQPITQGAGQISGRFTVEAANNLAILLKAGALPADFTFVEERVVGPGLGRDSIEAGKLSALISGVLIAIFTLITYGSLGVIALFALAVNVLLIFACLSIIGATLTLPGIAGIVLTVAMAVDSNVLIYERIREEARAGRSVMTALDSGFSRALATIIDANVTTLIGGVILFFVGSGSVKGFAVTLSLGIVTTVFTAFSLTRLIVAIWFRWFKPKNVLA